MEDGFEEAAAFGLGGGELRFQPVAQAHLMMRELRRAQVSSSALSK